MIPKIIHYCWFGRNPKPKLAEKCVKSWKKYCPDYKIIEWNEDNFDISSAPLYVRQAYEARKWAFMTDYIRLQVVYENGGIYLDTDVELKKSLDSLLENRAYFGFENGRQINTGLGFGAEKGTAILKELMDDYKNIPFVLEDGSFDKTPCPRRNTEIFLRHGLIQDDSMQLLCGNVRILPSIYLCPIDQETMIRKNAPETVSIHWFDASWQSEAEKSQWNDFTRKMRREHYATTVKQRVKALIGDRTYDAVKKNLKRGRNNDGSD